MSNSFEISLKPDSETEQSLAQCCPSLWASEQLWANPTCFSKPLEPYDSSAPYENYSWQREGRRKVYEHQKAIWDLTEPTIEICAGAWTAKKFAPKLTDAVKVPKSYQTTAAKNAGIAGSFGPLLLSSVMEYGMDRMVAPEEQKMEGTAIADCVVAPAISLIPARPQIKVGTLLLLHMVGRWIDHFRQPTESF